MTFAGKVFKVWHTLTRAGRSVGHFSSDLIFTDEGPMVVIEWNETEGGDVPAVTVRLDPAYLHEMKPPWPNADYLYEYPIDDPRPLS